MAAKKTAKAGVQLVKSAARAAKKVSKGSGTAKTASNGSTTKAAPAQSAKSAKSAKKASTKKASSTPATKKSTPTKAAAKKSAAAKPAPTKASTAKKTSATKAPAQKTPAKKATTKTAATPPAKKATKATSAKSATKATATKKAPVTAAKLVVREDESPWTAKELKEVRAELEAEIQRLTEEISTAETDLNEFLKEPIDGAGDDQADAGAKSFEREHELSLVAGARTGLEQNQHALDRLEDGTYGVCESCGNPIGKLRLQAYPRATLCMSCKSRQERR
ncbi:TraR/DksA family transcriptional regulator [Janibacter anophelis]|uniref:TraR/DksA family transcriptional regulator n=1 Tax=Janibacter anophelis TaxID=319054 RepID=UPI003F8066F9